MFDNVAGVAFGKGCKEAKGINSNEGEQLVLDYAVSTEVAIESWMTSLENVMKETMHTIVKHGVYHYAFNTRIDWLYMVLGQVSLSASQAWWTWETEDVFDKVKAGDKQCRFVINT